MCRTEDVRLILADVRLLPMGRGAAAPGKIARLMNQGRDNTVRGLQQTEYELDQGTANHLLERFQGAVTPKRLSAGQRSRVVASAETEDKQYVFATRLPDAGDTWIQAGHAAIDQRLFIVSMEVAARFRGNGLATYLLDAAVRHAESTRGPVHQVKGVAGGTNHRILQSGEDIGKTPFGRSMSRLGFEVTYNPLSQGMLATRRPH